MSKNMIKMTTVTAQPIIAYNRHLRFLASISSFLAFCLISKADCWILPDFFSISLTSSWLLMIYSRFCCILPFTWSIFAKAWCTLSLPGLPHWDSVSEHTRSKCWIDASSKRLSLCLLASPCTAPTSDRSNALVEASSQFAPMSTTQNRERVRTPAQEKSHFLQRYVPTLWVLTWEHDLCRLGVHLRVPRALHRVRLIVEVTSL